MNGTVPRPDCDFATHLGAYAKQGPRVPDASTFSKGDVFLLLRCSEMLVCCSRRSHGARCTDRFSAGSRGGLSAPTLLPNVCGAHEQRPGEHVFLRMRLAATSSTGRARKNSPTVRLGQLPSPRQIIAVRPLLLLIPLGFPGMAFRRSPLLPPNITEGEFMCSYA